MPLCKATWAVGTTTDGHAKILTSGNSDMREADVGRRIRAGRLIRRMSQSELANAPGVTFKQVQKYEKGISRVGAGRLARIAEVLNVPVAFFFGADRPSRMDLRDLKTPSIQTLDEDLPKAPAFRAAPRALDSFFRRGYSEEEIHGLVVPKRTLARRQSHHELLTVEETDKVLRLSRVASIAERVFGDKEKAHRWMRKPKRALDGETPLVYLASETGARLVEEMLNRIETGMLA